MSVASVIIRWAQKEVAVTLPSSEESSLTAGELTDQLNWTDEQFLNLVVTGA